MYSRPWVIVTAILCVIFAVLAFPIFAKVRGVATAVTYTVIGFVVIWLAYFVRAWAFSRHGFRNGTHNGSKPEQRC